MKTEIILTISFVIFSIIFVPAILVFGIRFIPSGIQPSLKTTQGIYKDIKLSQSFMSEEDNLSGIGVSIKNPQLINKKNIYIKLLDKNNNLLREVTLNGKNIADGEFVKITFDPIKDSKNRKFIWVTEAPDASKDDSLEIFLTDRKGEWSLEYKVNDEISDMSLSYVTLHKPDSKLQILKIILLGFSSNLKDDLPFLISYLTLLAILLFLVVKKSSTLSK